jgi:hypothetical protein
MGPAMPAIEELLLLVSYNFQKNRVGQPASSVAATAA